MSPYRRQFLETWALILAGLLVVAAVCYELGMRAADATWEATRVHIRY